MAAPERRDIIRTLLASGFYCGTVYQMPLRERLDLVKRLEARLSEGRHGPQDAKAQAQGRHDAQGR